MNGQLSAVKLEANLAYVADNAIGLQIFDLSIPQTPQLIGQYPQSNSTNRTTVVATDLELVGSVVYLVIAEQLHVVDVSDPRKPILIKILTTHPVDRIAAEGNYVYTTSSNSSFFYGGFCVYDVTSRSNPILKGRLAAGYGGDACPAGNYVYVPNGYSGFDVIDVSDKTAPKRIGGYDTAGYAASITVAGTTAYVSDYDLGLGIFDVSQPRTPVFLRYVHTKGPCVGLKISGSVGYLSELDQGIEVIDLANARVPEVVGHYDTGVFALAMDVSGTLGAIVTRTKLAVVDLTQVRNPQRLSVCAITRLAYNLELQGNYAFVAGLDAGVRVFDITDPAHPSWVSEDVQPVGNVALGIAASGNYIFVGEGGSPGVRVLDGSNPLNLVPVSWIPTSMDVYSVAAIDHYIYAGRFGLEVFDFSDVNTPVAVGEFSTNVISYAVRVSGGFAYVANGTNGFLIFDVTNPASPQLVATYASSGAARDVSIRGSLAAFCDGSGGMHLVDISDPRSPKQISTYKAAANANSAQITGDYVFLAASSAGVELIDISNPASPVRVARYDTPRSAIRLRVRDNIVYVADTDSFQILQADLGPSRIIPKVTASGASHVFIDGLSPGGTYKVQRLENGVWTDASDSFAASAATFDTFVSGPPAAGPFRVAPEGTGIPAGVVSSVSAAVELLCEDLESAVTYQILGSTDLATWNDVVSLFVANNPSELKFFDAGQRQEFLKLARQ